MEHDEPKVRNFIDLTDDKDMFDTFVDIQQLYRNNLMLPNKEEDADAH